MAKTKTSTTVKQRYIDKAYDRLAITIPKGRKEAVEAFAQSQGTSVNALVNNALRDALGVSEEEWRDKSLETIPYIIPN